MIPTFIYNPSDIADDIITLSGSEAHHIVSVIRLGRGDMIRMIDGRGVAHICEISLASIKKVVCRIVKTLKNSGEPNLDLILAIGLSTSSRFDSVIEKATEAGVSRFIPLLSEKGKVKLVDKSALSRKLNRWRRVCEAAVKQSGRSRIPEIKEPVSFDEFISTCDPTETVLFHPGDRTDNIEEAIGLRTRSRLTIIVGPESGFSTSELGIARDREIVEISIGSRVLRTETAGTVLPAILIYLAEIVKA